mmetsp:Transcript_67430/g.201429  ORF Transcript_67430/g.201429 Transcript_67430/m.201429 type:complete len:351 (-) Transcript_67430:761-1813(-)
MEGARVQTRRGRRDVLGHVLVVESEHEYGEGGEEDVVGVDVKVDEDLSGRAHREHREEEHRHDEAHVGVEDVVREDRHPTVGLPAVDEEQAAEEAELADGEVGVVDGLHPLLADDAHADLARLDHGDVVGAVSDGEAAALWHEVLDQVEHLGLLVLARAAGDDRVGAVGDGGEDLLAEGAAVLDGLLVEDEAEALAAARTAAHALAVGAAVHRRLHHLRLPVGERRAHLRELRVEAIKLHRQPVELLHVVARGALRTHQVRVGDGRAAAAVPPPHRPQQPRAAAVAVRECDVEPPLRRGELLHGHVGEHRVRLRSELECVGLRWQDVARGRDVLRRAHLVARQHPHLDAR